MPLGAGDDPHSGRTGEPVLLDVPARALEHRVPRGRKAGDVRHLAARHEGERGAWRKPQEIHEPRTGDLFDHRGGRAADDEARVLVPRAGQPVGRERRRQRPADDEAEVASARDPDDAALGLTSQSLDHLEWLAWLVRQVASEGHSQLLDRGGRPNGPLVERLEEVGSDLSGSPEERAIVSHAASSFSKRSGSSNGPTTAR